jgi:hypothetical protein
VHSIRGFNDVVFVAEVACDEVSVRWVVVDDQDGCPAADIRFSHEPVAAPFPGYV